MVAVAAEAPLAGGEPQTDSERFGEADTAQS